jgi:hypothetical protein
MTRLQLPSMSVKQRQPLSICLARSRAVVLWACAGSGSRPFFVMDLLGSNLSTVRKSALLPGGRADFETAKVIAAAMLRALEDVHRAGHIHRDVKPANFCMSPPDATDLSAGGLGLWEARMAERVNLHVLGSVSVGGGFELAQLCRAGWAALTCCKGK